MAATVGSEIIKEALIHNNFRRQSLTDHGVLKLETHRVPTILLSMGQPFDMIKLNKFMKHMDPHDTGLIDHDQYLKLCKEFVKHPAAMAKYEGDEFSFKHLIGKNDFASP